MIRLHFVVEGLSEKQFVDLVLKPHLAMVNVFTDCRLVETRLERRTIAGRVETTSHRGGSINYQHWKRDLQTWMKSDRNPDARFTTLLDLYKIPSNFPGFKAAQDRPAAERADMLQDTMADDLELSPGILLPYIQVHELEALLLSDVAKFADEFPERTTAILALADSLSGRANKEEIDDGPSTAPSKRIIAVVPGYERRKVQAAPRIALQIGLAKMRESCPRFGRWLASLEKLAQ
jgi:hypothetical protein